MRTRPLLLAVAALSMGACQKKSEPASAATATNAAAPAKAAPAPTPAALPKSAAAPAATPPAMPSAAPGATGAAKPAATERAAATRTMTYGRPIAAQESITIDEVLRAPEGFAGKEVVVRATVRRVCQRKGCWMEVAPSTDRASQGARVTFKDYGFFVPMDAAGSEARLQGTIAVKKIAKAEVAHMEGEGARFAKKEADGSAHEIRFVATGVELTRR